jgi:hypothetical protein
VEYHKGGFRFLSIKNWSRRVKFKETLASFKIVIMILQVRSNQLTLIQTDFKIILFTSLFFVYLTSIIAVTASNGKMINELECMWKEALIWYSEMIFRNLPEGQKKITKNRNQNIRSLGRDLNPGLLEYEGGRLTTRSRHSTLKINKPPVFLTCPWQLDIFLVLCCIHSDRVSILLVHQFYWF